MDFRYETKDSAREFHKKRVAFIIYNDKIEFIKGSGMSHWEYCQLKGISRDEFNQIIRGYYLNNAIVFYKDNFIYDNNVINEGLKYIDIIMKECNIKKANIYFGLKVDKYATIWPYDHYYGEVSKDGI